MALTPAQFAKQQASLPTEDRISYLDYLQTADPAEYARLTKPTTSTLQQLKTAETTAASPAKVPVSAAESAAAARAKAAADLKAKQDADKAVADATAKQEAQDAYYTKIVSNGKTQAQLDALDNAIKTASQITESYSGIGLTSTVDPKTGKVVTTNNTAAKIAADKAAAEAAAKAAQDAAIKAAQDAAAKAEKDRIAAEAAATAARTAEELQKAKDALAAANKAAADAAAAAKAALDKANADAAAAAAKADADLKAAQEAGSAAAIKAAQEAKAAADAAAAAAVQAARQAQAEAEAALANTNINVTGNTVIPFAGTTQADIAAKLAADQALEQKMAERIATSQMLADRFKKYNLTSLAPKIKELAINGANEATIMLELQETEEYKRRFKANEERIKKNLSVLSPAEYLNVEDGYRQVLRSYGLNQFDTDDYVSQFIANDVSPNEFSNRVVTAVQRIQNADPAITKQLRDYYGIGQNDLVAYVLDPEQQFQKIERQVAASEIGVAAARQGLTAGVSVAEQLAAQGVTQAEAQKGYATIADILPTAEKLSEIYGKTMDTYGQSEAEQEVFNSLASAQRKRQKLTARELAAFGGMSGTNRTSLTTSSVGQFQNPERTYRPRQRIRPRVGASQFPRTELWPAN